MNKSREAAFINQASPVSPAPFVKLLTKNSVMLRLRHVLYGLDDGVIAGAAADVARYCVFYLLFGGVGSFPQEGRCGHQEPRRAESALQGVILLEGQL